jgi:hypothetical protein
VLTGLVLVAAVAVTACDDESTEPITEMFDVTVENVSEVYDFSASGAFATPVGASSPGPLLPGNAYEVTFAAAPGQRLSFATMFVQSNDWFYAPSEEGIALFDGSGMPTTGDITDQLLLWDAGTETDQEPGLGEDQAPRQSGPDTGAADDDMAVRLVSDEYDVPAASEVILATLEHAEGNMFTLRIENVSTGSTLMTSDGATHPVPLAPGVFVVHTDPAPLFEAGEPEPGDGLEGLAEDGTVADLSDALAERTGLTSPLAPGVWAVHEAGAMPMFTAGATDYGEGLEALAEDGNPSALASALTGSQLVSASGVFNTPDGAGSPGPLLPGSSYSFTVTASPGDRLSVATMLVKSNDLFYGFDDDGIALFNGDIAVSGEVDDLYLWDAGTEVNEAPGAGPNQPLLQGSPDTGPAENGTVRMVDDPFSYPDVADVVRITITPRM